MSDYWIGFIAGCISTIGVMCFTAVVYCKYKFGD